MLWKKTDSDTAELMPTTLAVSGGRVFFHSTEEVICLEAHSGKPKWRAARPVSRNRPAWSAPTLVIYQDVVLSADRAARPPDFFKTDDPVAAIEGRTSGALMVISATDGRPLAECPLERPPVFDGMAAAGGRVYLALTDGNVLCFGPAK